jgi:hypothetical protein
MVCVELVTLATMFWIRSSQFRCSSAPMGATDDGGEEE